MPQKLLECPHCHGAKICKFDHGKSCETCKISVGMGRKGRPGAVRCSFCTGHGRIWTEVAEEAPAAEKAAAEAAAEPVAEAPAPAAEEHEEAPAED